MNSNNLERIDLKKLSNDLKTNIYNAKLNIELMEAQLQIIQDKLSK